jgi:hypothetical protein
MRIEWIAHVEICTIGVSAEGAKRPGLFYTVNCG